LNRWLRGIRYGREAGDGAVSATLPKITCASMVDAPLALLTHYGKRSILAANLAC